MSPTDPNQGRPPERPWVDRVREEIYQSVDREIGESFDLLPAEYFERISESDQLAHLKALIAVRICDLSQEVMLRHPDGRRITMISQENYAGFLADLIRRLPDQGELVGAQIFSSRDKKFVIDIFDFRPTTDKLDPGRVPAAIPPATVDQIAKLTGAAGDSIQEFLESYHPDNPILHSPEEIAKQFLALRETRTTSDLAVNWEVRPAPDPNGSGNRYAKVVVSSIHATTRKIFQRAAEFLGRYLIDIERAFCENISLADGSRIALSTFQIRIENDAFERIHEQVGPDSSRDLDGDVLRSRLITYLRLDDEVVSNERPGNRSIVDLFGNARRAELFCGLARLTHYAVIFRRPVDVSRDFVFRTLLRNEHTPGILAAFEQRFGQTGSELPAEPEGNLDSITDAKARWVVETFWELARSIDRCNLSLERRRALAFRFSGELFANAEAGETPFAIFYVYGQGFDGFHVRFRDVARGGLRLVPTRSTEQYLFESFRTYDEVYRLASAQQLKNKDIAEGGAKAVVVVQPGGHLERAGCEFVDGLLDLVLNDRETTAVGVEPGPQEYLYLGPDEHVSNRLIGWIVDRADARGYPMPTTLMSSKPETGINHKEFGVTSEGVAVFLHQSLLEAGIDPTRDSFTIKMTGGPDGDVGGNAIRILIREYGPRVIFVAIADGTGAASDPDGLDHGELLRLVDTESGMAEFSASKLGPRGEVRGLVSEADVAWRNSRHCQVRADVFLPAGGRPSTINLNNWQEFLDDQGNPSSRIVVEGANLFITEPARQQLSAHGVTIVKDSSANKCGVICSSLEVIAGMVLAPADFQAIKPTYVAEVLQLLKSLARIEAVSLFNEHGRQPGLTLSEVSVALSREIIRVADVILASFDGWSDAEIQLTNDFILEFLPPSLVARCDGELIGRIPEVYRKQLAASVLSSRIVYREGYRNVSELSSESLERLVHQQLKYESELREILQRLQQTDLPDRDRIIAILNHAGVRAQRELKL